MLLGWVRVLLWEWEWELNKSLDYREYIQNLLAHMNNSREEWMRRTTIRRWHLFPADL
jgi:hypothetical protein